MTLHSDHGAGTAARDQGIFSYFPILSLFVGVNELACDLHYCTMSMCRNVAMTECHRDRCIAIDGPPLER